MNPSPSAGPAAGEPRRGFFAKLLAGAVGMFVAVFPFATGLLVFLDPLARKKSAADNWLPITTLDALPDDGLPHRYPVIASKTDAWTVEADQRVGAVYLRRLPDGKVEAFTAVCPHAGCFIEFKDDAKQYACPCHTSAFALDGKPIAGPSPRPMDALQAMVDPTDGTTVRVAYQNFICGIEHQVAQ